MKLVPNIQALKSGVKAIAVEIVAVSTAVPAVVLGGAFGAVVGAFEGAVASGITTYALSKTVMLGTEATTDFSSVIDGVCTKLNEERQHA